MRAAGGGAIIFVNNVPEMMDSPPYPIYPNSNSYAANMATSVISQVGAPAGTRQLRLAQVFVAPGISANYAHPRTRGH